MYPCHTDANPLPWRDEQAEEDWLAIIHFIVLMILMFQKWYWNIRIIELSELRYCAFSLMPSQAPTNHPFCNHLGHHYFCTKHKIWTLNATLPFNKYFNRTRVRSLAWQCLSVSHSVTFSKLDGFEWCQLPGDVVTVFWVGKWLCNLSTAGTFLLMSRPR